MFSKENNGYLSENGKKSIMRLGFIILIVVGCLLALFVAGIWGYAVIRNLNITYPSTPYSDHTDMSQMIYLVAVILGTATGGKFLQKIVEKAKSSTIKKHLEITDGEPKEAEK